MYQQMLLLLCSVHILQTSELYPAMDCIKHPHTEFPAVSCDDSIIWSHILMKILSDLTSQSPTSVNYNSCSAFLTLKIGYFTFQIL